MKIYQKYILKQIILSSIFFYFIFNFLFIFLKLLDFSEKIINGSITFSSAFYLSFLLVPSFSIFTIPLVCLSSVLFTFSKLSSSNEIFALKSFGISINSLSKIVLLFGTFFFIAGIFNNLYIVPISSKLFLNEVKKVLNFKRESFKPETFNAVFPSCVIYFKKFDKKRKIMKKIFIYDRFNKTSPETIIAENGFIKIRNNIFIVNLTKGNIYLKKSDNIEILSFENYNLKFNIADELSKFTINLKDKESSISEIKKRIEYFKKRGNFKKVNYLLMEIHKRFSLPFTAIIFSIVGIIFGIQNRRNPNSWTILILFAIIFFYYSLIMLSSYLVKINSVSAFLGSWIPNILLGIITIILYYFLQREKLQ